MKEKLKENFKNKKTIIMLILGALVFLGTIIGATYAYFSVTAANNTTNTDTTGSLSTKGNAILRTNISQLYLNLDGVLMSESNVGSKYYATSNESGTPILEENVALNNGIYTLATASTDEGATGYDCDYTYSLTGTVANEITDSSDEDIKVRVMGDSLTNGYQEFTLKDILSGGQTLTGTFESISHETPQTIRIQPTVENTSRTQDDFKGNNYSITLTPESFSCSYTINTPVLRTALSNNVVSYTVEKGTFDVEECCINTDPIDTTSCEWEPVSEEPMTFSLMSFGTYYAHAKDSNGHIGHSGAISYESSVLATKLINRGDMWQSNLVDDGYRFIGTGDATSGTTPDNFICFGTTSKEECKANEPKYLYRIMGVFSDSTNNNHAKLIKYQSLPTLYKYHSSNNDANWGSTSLFSGLNGSYFLTNSAYNYMQNSTWSNKITNWTWSAVNTMSCRYEGTAYRDYSPSQMYLHEMNKTGKPTTIGSWTNPQAKIGLMYASDYTLSLGETSKSLTSSTTPNDATLIQSWMFLGNNSFGTTTSLDTVAGSLYSWEWTIARYGSGCGSGADGSWVIREAGQIESCYTYYYVYISARPVFYLNSDVEYSSGSGDYTDPFILEL